MDSTGGCVHHWRVAEQVVGGVFPALCLKCGANHDFPRVDNEYGGINIVAWRNAREHIERRAVLSFGRSARKRALE